MQPIKPIRPTHAPDSEIQQYLLHRGINTMRWMAGYRPRFIPISEPSIPPVATPYDECASSIMAKLCNTTIGRCNPRAPYVVLSWLLVGQLNPYRVAQFSTDGTIPLTAMLMLRIACGEIISEFEMKTVVETAKNTAWQKTSQPWDAERAAKAAAWSVATVAAHPLLKGNADDYIRKTAEAANNAVAIAAKANAWASQATDSPYTEYLARETVCERAQQIFYLGDTFMLKMLRDVVIGLHGVPPKPDANNTR
jgi:hypothetical protein